MEELRVTQLCCSSTVADIKKEDSMPNQNVPQGDAGMYGSSGSVDIYISMNLVIREFHNFV